MNELLPPLAATERKPRGQGVGPGVVFLHGLGCDRTQFEYQLVGLDPRLRLIALDLPGHGDSPSFRATKYDVQSIAEAVSRDLAVRGYEDFILVGHSAGGLISLQIATTQPNSVRGIVVLDTTIALTEVELRANRARSEESENSNWRQHFMTSMIDSWGSRIPVPGSILRTLEQTPEHVARPFWHNILNFESETLWRHISVPALYLRSRRETDLPLLRTLNPLISAIDLRKSCEGHWPHLQCPEAIIETLHTHLAEVGILH